MNAFRSLLAILCLLGAPLVHADEPTPPAAVMPELKPVPGKPVSIWFNFSTGDFKGAAHIWGELKNDSPKPLAHVRILFAAHDRNGKVIGTSSDSVQKLEPGETWSFQIRPKEEEGVRRFELIDVEVH